jgi:hypothetical protein
MMMGARVSPSHKDLYLMIGKTPAAGGMPTTVAAFTMPLNENLDMPVYRFAFIACEAWMAQYVNNELVSDERDIAKAGRDSEVYERQQAMVCGI